MRKKKKADKPGAWAFIKSFARKKPLGAAGFIFLLLMLLIAIFADVIAPYRMINGVMPNNILYRLQVPYLFLSPEARAAANASGKVFLLGTDSLGVDVLSYLIYGARTSVVLALTVTILSVFVSVTIGTLSAVIGGWFDLIIQRIVDAWLCIPGILITLLLMSMFGRGLLQLIIVMSIPGGIVGSRMIRSAAISVKDSGYVKMAEIIGSGVWWKTMKHVLPNIMPVIILSACGGIGGVIMMEAGLNFLGFGVNVGTPSWGFMITNQGRANMYTAPWLSLYPGILISLMVFAANMFGDGLRDMIDPRLKGGTGSYDLKKIRRLAAKYERKSQKRARKEDHDYGV